MDRNERVLWTGTIVIKADDERKIGSFEACGRSTVLDVYRTERLTDLKTRAFE